MIFSKVLVSLRLRDESHPFSVHIVCLNLNFIVRQFALIYVLLHGYCVGVFVVLSIFGCSIVSLFSSPD